MSTEPGRIRTTHTGSLPRPGRLIELMYQQEDDQPVVATDLAAAQLEAVNDAVARQRRSGIDIVSDGEMSKAGFVNYITRRVSGFSGLAQPWVLNDLMQFPELLIDQYGGPAGAHIVVKNCTGELRYQGHAEVAADIERLLAAIGPDANGTAGFLPATSPGCVAMCFPNQHYADYETYLFALAAALREEYTAILDAGLTLQIDCPDLPMGAHTSAWDNTPERLGFQGYLELHVAALNAAVEGLPQDRIRIHLCWGNYTGPHQMDAPLTDVLPAVLKATPVGLSFEAANPRHEHEWEDIPGLKIPEEKVLIPGVIDVKHNVLEHPRLVSQRLTRFADQVGRDRVIGGTDCGFGTFVGFGAIHPTVSWHKLDSLADGARLASGS